MADKKLSSVNSVSDASYLYAETSSGETVKISKADLASVVAGIIGNASITKVGLMPSGYAYGTSTRTIAQNEVYKVGGINGLFLFQDIASYSHWHIMFKAKGVLIDLSNKAFGYLKLSLDGDDLVISNTNGGTARSATLIFQNINLFAK